MTRDEESAHIEQADRIARMAHNEALRLAKLEIERVLMSMSVQNGVLLGLLRAMDKIMVSPNADITGV